MELCGDWWKRQILQEKADEAFGFNNKVGCLYRLLVLLHLQLECPEGSVRRAWTGVSRNLSSYL